MNSTLSTDSRTQSVRIRKRGRGRPGGRNLKENSKQETQFSKHVFGFSKLGFVLESSQTANLVNCAFCLENDFLNSASPPPSPPDPPPGRLREPPGTRGPLEASGSLLTSGGLRGPWGPPGTTCPALGPKSASAGVRRPKGALSRPKRAPVLPKI